MSAPVSRAFPPAAVSSLQTFLLDGNCLSALPEELGSLLKLSYLGLSFNRFSHVPQVLERLASMERLCMAGNSLDTLVLQNFRLLRVKHLDLRYAACTHTHTSTRAHRTRTRGATVRSTRARVAYEHTRTHANLHACTYARIHTHLHARTRMHAYAQIFCKTPRTSP